MVFLSSGGLRMSDGMSDRASRSASGRIPGPWAIWSRHRGPWRSSRGTRIVRECSASVRVSTRGTDGTTVRGDLRSSRTRASKPRVLALARIRKHGYSDNRTRETSSFALATVRYISRRLLEMPSGSSSAEEPRQRVSILLTFSNTAGTFRAARSLPKAKQTEYVITRIKIYGMVIYSVIFKRGWNFSDENIDLSIKII